MGVRAVALFDYALGLSTSFANGGKGALGPSGALSRNESERVRARCVLDAGSIFYPYLLRRSRGVNARTMAPTNRSTKPSVSENTETEVARSEKLS